MLYRLVWGASCVSAGNSDKRERGMGCVGLWEAYMGWESGL